MFLSFVAKPLFVPYSIPKFSFLFSKGICNLSISFSQSPLLNQKNNKKKNPDLNIASCQEGKGDTSNLSLCLQHNLEGDNRFSLSAPRN